MPGEPGDYGIEGWTTAGLAFQCYCPEKHYTQKELYAAMRKKMTDDIPKLRDYQTEIADRLGDTKIKHWLFVTPQLDHNRLYAHARKKEAEARAWNLPILEKDFSILIHDAGHYAPELEHCRRLDGTISLGPVVTAKHVLPDIPEEFEKLIDKKNRIRLRDRAGSPTFDSDLRKINSLTEAKFLQCDQHLASIERASPQAFEKILRVIGHYADEMQELQYVWNGEPNHLVDTVKSELGERLEKELTGVIGYSDARRTADLMISRWLAVCQLDFRE